MKDEIVLIPFGNEFVAMTREAFQEGIEKGRHITGATASPENTKPIPKLLDADQACELTGVPASWFLEAARQDRIPHLKMGKYVRFKMSDVYDALAVRPQKL